MFLDFFIFSNKAQAEIFWRITCSLAGSQESLRNDLQLDHLDTLGQQIAIVDFFSVASITVACSTNIRM